MSSAAMFKGLAAATGTIGQGLLQQQAYEKQAALDSAKARREASLAQLEREWEQQDAATERAHDFDKMAFESTLDKEAAMRERENPGPKTQAEIARIEAQTGASQALTEKRRAEIEQMGKSDSGKLFGVVRPDSVTPSSAQKFQDHYDRTGETRWDLLESKKGSPEADRFKVMALKNASQRTDEQFRWSKDEPPRVETFLEMNPQLAQELEITPDTPVTDAMNKVQMHAYKNQIQSFGSEFGVGGQQQGQPEPRGGGGNAALLDGVLQGAQDQGLFQGSQQIGGGQQPVAPPMGTMPGAGQQGQPAPLVERAVDAIQRGAPAEAVIQRMREQGASEAEIRQVQQAIANVR